ncbi:MAG: DHH family phosphoesterase, partial [Burkholderiales bacterium]|nr:DHH family phosphoesterase [Burkholderiales bacterium]
MTKFSIRRFNPTVVKNLTAYGVREPLARALAARGVRSINDLQYDLSELIPPNQLMGCTKAGEILADAILQDKNIVVIGDYDCDGATACAVGVKGLGLLGARKASFIIPDREKDGYGLSPNLVEKALEEKADVIVTVDNGISALEAVDYAKSKGLTVIVTDHHLPGEKLPAADCIVDPNQPDDTFESKALAGVGVIFYVLLATRAALRDKGLYKDKKQPNLLSLIDLVALGTVADVVPLDKNNRIIVTKGLEKIRQGKMQPGISSLLKLSGRNSVSLDSHDLAFAVAPRINAAGRLSDISCGVNCLISPNYNEA